MKTLIKTAIALALFALAFHLQTEIIFHIEEFLYEIDMQSVSDVIAQTVETKEELEEVLETIDTNEITLLASMLPALLYAMFFTASVGFAKS